MSFQWLFDRPIAHRGLHNAEFPENSMPAYQNAIDHNFNIEIDVHVTNDGEMVVFHDDNLKRVCGVNKVIKRCTLQELKSYPLLDKAGNPTEYRMPTLKEFLQLVDGKVGILCEIKGLLPIDFSIVRETIKVLKEVDYKGNIALQSFNFGAVLYAKHHSHYPVGELCTWASPIIKKLRRSIFTLFMGQCWINLVTRPDFIAYDVTAVPPINLWIKAHGYLRPVLMWTINSDKKIERAKKYANNIIFENLDADKVDALAGKFMPYHCPKCQLPENKKLNHLR